MYCKKCWIYKTQIWQEKIVLDKHDLENKQNVKDTLQEITEGRT